MAGCDIANGAASSATLASPSVSRARIARRVGSASAPKTASSWSAITRSFYNEFVMYCQGPSRESAGDPVRVEALEPAVTRSSIGSEDATSSPSTASTARPPPVTIRARERLLDGLGARVADRQPPSRALRWCAHAAMTSAIHRGGAPASSRSRAGPAKRAGSFCEPSAPICSSRCWIRGLLQRRRARRGRRRCRCRAPRAASARGPRCRAGPPPPLRPGHPRHRPWCALRRGRRRRRDRVRAVEQPQLDGLVRPGVRDDERPGLVPRGRGPAKSSSITHCRKGSATTAPRSSRPSRRATTSRSAGVVAGTTRSTIVPGSARGGRATRAPGRPRAPAGAPGSRPRAGPGPRRSGQVVAADHGQRPGLPAGGPPRDPARELADRGPGAAPARSEATSRSSTASPPVARSRG